MACDQAKLQAAKDALHNLVTGQMAKVIVDQNGERVEFQLANRDALRAYIRELEADCNAVSGIPRPTGPFGFTF